MSQRRVWTIVGWALGGGLVVAFLAGVGTAVYIKVQRRMEEEAAGQVHPKSTAGRRQARQQPIAEVGPAPLPQGLPFVVREGSDTFGYPRSYVDAPGLRSLLEFQHYDELTQAFERFQSDFEADHRRELWPLVAGGAFSTAVPRLRALLDAWQQKTPDSFAPYLARGEYLLAVAWAQRGGGWAAATATEDMRLFHETARQALADLDHALELRPKLLAAHTVRIGAFKALGQKEKMLEVVGQSAAICSDCLSVRASYLRSTTPRWGGSYAAMDAFAQVPLKTNPALELLKGLADDDRADMALLDKDGVKALEYAEKACARGPYAFALSKRAEAKRMLGRADEALADIDAALELRPDVTSLHIDRAQALALQKRWKEAALELLIALRVDTTDPTARGLLGFVYQGLVADADAAAARGERPQAVDLYDLAEALFPFGREVQTKRSAAIVGGFTGTPAEIEQLEAERKNKPDDLLTVLRFDYVLSQQNAFPRIIAAWTEYIARHPDSARAYQERSGAYSHTGQRRELEADLDQACRLGHHQACGMLHALRPAPAGQ